MVSHDPLTLIFHSVFKNPQSDFFVDFSKFLSAFCLILFFRLTFSGLYHKHLRQIPSVLKFLVHGDTPETTRKLHESLWYASWHSISLVFGVFVIFLSKNGTFNRFQFTFDTDELESIYYENQPHLMEGNLQDFYIIQCAFWATCLAFISLENIRKDFKEMIAHHFATIGLIAFSYTGNYFRIGSLVVLLHDISDVFLYWAKFFHYLKFDFTADRLFEIFAVSFFILRIIFLPWIILKPSFGFYFKTTWRIFISTGDWDVFYGDLAHICLTSLMQLMYFLHIYWFSIILKMVKKMIEAKSIKDIGDIRSETDEDSDVNDLSK